jgi:uncharacterized protein YqkB
VWKGGTSGGHGIKTVTVNFQANIKSLDLSNIDNPDSISIYQCINLEKLKLPSFKSTALSIGMTAYNTKLASIDISTAIGIKSLNINANPLLTTLLLPAEPINPITSFSIISNSELQGTLDISSYKFGDNINISLYSNKLNNILLPDTSTLINNLRINNNQLTGIIDFSKLSGLKNGVHIGNNAGVTSVIFPETSANFSNVDLSYCSLNSADLSNLTGGISSLTLSGNSPMTSLILPDSSYPFNSFYHSSLPGMVTLDVSNRIFKDCSFSIDGCPNLTKLILPDASCSFNSFFAQSGKLTGILDLSNHYFKGSIIIYNHNPLTQIILDKTKLYGLTSFSMRNCTNLIGTYDLSDISTLTSVNVEYTDISNIIPPANARNLSYNISGSYCASDGIIDLSSVASLRGLEARLTDASIIYWPYDVSSAKLYNFKVDGCNFSGVIDLSIFSEIEGEINISDNIGITGLILPETLSSYSYGGWFYANNCNLQGNLDLSKKRVQSQFYLNSNPNLVSIDMPSLVSSSNYWLNGRFHNCGLNQTTVDNILSSFSNLFQQFTISYPFNLSLEGGTNAIPTDGSLNIDISTLKYRFSQAGRVLTLTYNI